MKPDDPEQQSEEEPADSDQPSAQSDDAPTDNDQSTEQSDAQPAEETDQPEQQAGRKGSRCNGPTGSKHCEHHAWLENRACARRRSGACILKL